MKKLLFGALLSSTVVCAQEPLYLPVTEVHDGDSIYVRLPLPMPLNAATIRVKGIDTPEMPADSYRTTGKLGRAKCRAEAEAALAARDLVIRMLSDGKDYRNISVSNYEWDKYGGRIVGTVKVGSDDIATALIASGYAVVYDGTTAKQSWCK